MALANSKSVLAKLLAQENISVEHRKTQTAYFDPTNRVLVLPIWKDMDTDLYDLLVGHEVGHAWETPAEGWHNALNGQKRGFKSYLNVVEDARIERCIKSRYPGLRSCFYKAYKGLADKDFFGIAEREISTLNLIDRINLHFKIGPFLAVPFSVEEQFYVKQIENLSDWDDVVRVATDLYNRRKEELEEEYEDSRRRGGLDEIQDYEYEDGDAYDDYDSEYNRDEDTMADDDAGGVGAGGEPDFDPKSLTDEEFRKRESELVSDEIKPYRYATLPLINTKDFIIPHKKLYAETDWQIIDEDYGAGDPMFAEYNVPTGDALYSNYKQTNSKFIQYLVKEFELKRNAAQFARAHVAKTGELDIDKVFGYKFKTDLFKRVTVVPGGKNHGMVMFIDWSGSMTDIIKQTIEQTLILADFCKKVNIPFRVFAFSDSDQNNKGKDIVTIRKTKYSQRVGDLSLDNHSTYMLELLSNTMTSSQYHYAQKRLLQVGHVFGRIHRRHYVPHGWNLSGTPLNEALVFANYYIPEFKEMHRLDIVNTIVLTDGEANETEEIIATDGRRKHMNSVYGIGWKGKANTVITDKQTGKTGFAKPGQPITAALLDLLKNRTGTNLVGYYILSSVSKYRINGFIMGQGLVNEDTQNIIHKIKKEKFYAINSYVYDKYFLVKSDDLNINDEELKVKSDSSKKDILKSFMQSQKSKIVNRVLLNKFIAEIA
jgi:hypothetical protein